MSQTTEIQKAEENQINMVKTGSALLKVRGEIFFTPIHRIFQWIIQKTDILLPDHLNPVANAGGIANLSFMIATASGILLLFWYVPSVHKAYDSLVWMSEHSPYLAGLMRSIHRYSSDVCIMFATIHGAHLFFARRFTGPRWLAWITGIVSIGFLWFVGWIGYWLVWDSRGKAIAIHSAKLVDFLPIFTDPLYRSFLTDANMNTLLFFVVFFFHMLMPLAMGIFLWLHITRLNRSKFIPGLVLSLVTVGSFILLSLIKPAINTEIASVGKIQNEFLMDYFYMVPLFIIERISGGTVWGLAFLSGLVLFTIPWTLGKGKVLESKVNIDRCNACKKCYEDCPYNAITMLPRSDGKKFDAEASVNPDLCVGCGICNGSCNTAGVGVEWLETQNIRKKLESWVQEISQTDKLKETGILFLCAESAGKHLSVNETSGLCQDLPGYRVIRVPCSGWIHSNLLSFLRQKGIDTIVVAGCSNNLCSYREGSLWTELRIDGKREPGLKSETIPNSPIFHLKLSQSETSKLIRLSLNFLQNKITIEKPKSSPIKIILGYILIGIVFGTLVYKISDYPYSGKLNQNDANLYVTFKHPGKQSLNCRTLTQEELDKMLPHMRKPTVCERKRYHVNLKLSVDGKEIINKSYIPKGIWEDGNSIALESIPISKGIHKINLQLSEDSGETWGYTDEKELEIKKDTNNVIIFSKEHGFTWY